MAFPHHQRSNTSPRQQQHPLPLPTQQAPLSGFTGLPRYSGQGSSAAEGPAEPQFDIFEWYPYYQSCIRFFLDHSQHDAATQAVAAFLNIHLPFQVHDRPVFSSTPSPNPASVQGPAAGQPFGSLGQPPRRGTSHSGSTTSNHVSLIPYLRRLVVTGFDVPAVLHGWFGDDWQAGVGLMHEQERRNYLFAAKAGGLRLCMRLYDLSSEETVPFYKPLRAPEEPEFVAADNAWSEWLKMEDWVIGSRAWMAEQKARERMEREEEQTSEDRDEEDRMVEDMPSSSTGRARHTR